MTKKISLYKYLCPAFIFLNAMQVRSQNNFAYKASLAVVKENKFYKIDLPPQVIAKCKPGLEDIRIFDQQGKQVSYILKNDLPAFSKENIMEFPIVKNSKENDKQTHVIVQSIRKTPVDNLVLFIKKTEAKRAFTISGSDDSVHWFIIKENIDLDNFINNDGDNITQVISFAPNSYSYFQVTILGENVLPFNIIKAGTYNEDVTYGRYVKIPGPSFIQRDSSDKKSYLWLKFDDKYLVNKLDFTVEGLKYFNRDLLALDNNKRVHNILLHDFLRSGSSNNFMLNYKGDHMLLVVDNEDNTPLKVSKVEALQLNISLLAYLQVGNNYSVSFGDSTLQAPVYDLTLFSDSIEKNPSIISLKSIEFNKNVINKPVTSNNNQLVLWIIIIGILLILCFFTVKMLKEVEAKKENN